MPTALCTRWSAEWTVPSFSSRTLDGVVLGGVTAVGFTWRKKWRTKEMQKKKARHEEE